MRSIEPEATGSRMYATLAIAFSMSADAFAAALGKGAALHKPRLLEAFRTAAVFGAMEMLAPVIGWAAGLAASPYVAALDHWIAFCLLGIIGLRMIWESFARVDGTSRLDRHSYPILIATAVGTSIDALAIGVTLAFLKADILITALAIGLTTFCLTAFGVMLGRLLGARIGRMAEALGGVLLLLIGTHILLLHLGVLG
jgi:putative Mn2+ efflux pump MntP